MLNENLKEYRKRKGMSQEELADKLNVVRQTISKWEQGLSVPDSEMLIKISESLEVPVSTLLGETVSVSDNEDTLNIISDKLTSINEMFAKKANKRRKIIRGLSFSGLSIAVIYIMWQIITLIRANSFFVFDGSAGTSSIGGAECPASVFVTASGFNPTLLIVLVIVLLISICGICLTRTQK